MKWLALTVCLITTPALAQEFPALYDVTGVSPNDVLNIRSAPTAASTIVGRFSPDASNIEVTGFSENGRWGRVNAGESRAWVSLSYLARQSESDPFGFTRCFGTEPFWSLSQTVKGLDFSTPEGSGWTEAIVERGMSQNRTDRAYIRTAEALVIIRRTSCNDGMSDMAFGLDADIVIGNGPHLTGCCTLQPD